LVWFSVSGEWLKNARAAGCGLDDAAAVDMAAAGVVREELGEEDICVSEMHWRELRMEERR
jgi:bifunctional ADP-heptose synthase (sugar kinase/adenylyltransferase)